jgi:hypothetical protein
MEIFQERKELREDVTELRGDRKDLRSDLKTGASSDTTLGNTKQEIEPC